MGIRDTLNKNPALSYGIAGAFVVVALAIVVWHFMPEKSVNMSKAYFTVDDGATYFVDDSSKNPPFDHDGKQAVRAFVYTYDDGAKEFVGYLLKYTDDLKSQLDDPNQAKNLGPMAAQSGSLVKPPQSSKDWVPFGSRDGHLIAGVHSPDGSVLDSKIPGYNAAD